MRRARVEGGSVRMAGQRPQFEGIVGYRESIFITVLTARKREISLA